MYCLAYRFFITLLKLTDLVLRSQRLLRIGGMMKRPWKCSFKRVGWGRRKGIRDSLPPPHPHPFIRLPRRLLETRLLRSLELTSGLEVKELVTRDSNFCRTRKRLTFLGQPSCRACAQEHLLSARSTSLLAKKSQSFTSAAQKNLNFESRVFLAQSAAFLTRREPTNQTGKTLC